jgi:PST family polysaccharide transporter
VRVASGLVVLKAIALSLGAAGFAQFAQVQNLVLMLSASAATGLGNGVTRLIAHDRLIGSRDEHVQLRRVMATALWFAICVTMPVSLVLLVTAEIVAAWLFGDPTLSSFIRCAAAALPFACLAPIPLAALNGQRESMRCVLAPIFTNLAGSVVTVSLVLALELPGAALAIVASQALALAVNAAFFLSRNPTVKLRSWLTYDRQVLDNLLGFAVMAVVGGLALQGAQLFIRTSLATDLGWDAAGQWQAVVKISEIYLSVITVALTVYYLPRLSGIAHRDDFLALLREALMLLVPSTLTLAAGIWLLREHIVTIALSAEFAPAADVIWLQLIGDVLKILSFPFAMVMWARGMITVYLILELGSSAMYASLAWWWIDASGVAGALAAHAVMYGVYGALCAWVALQLKNWGSTSRPEEGATP